MSGTSMDGINAAAIIFENDRPKILKTHYQCYPEKLRTTLQAVISSQWRGPLSSLLRLDHQIGQAFSEAAATIIQALPTHRFYAIGTHGQTIFHQPYPPYPNTWQLGDPSLIAERTGVTTIADWRRRDMAAGGQGAPLTPAFHAQVFRHTTDSVIINLGGIANITLIPGNLAQPVIGFDTGPANTLMDNWILRHQGEPYDHNGRWAASEEPDQSLLKKMLTDPFFAKKPPKSTGREYWNMAWLDQQLASQSSRLDPVAIQATLLELTARSIANAVQKVAPKVEQIFVCGGGVHNAQMMKRITALCAPCAVKSTAEAGFDPDFVEAIAFAWLAQQTLAGHPIKLANITGAKDNRILGAIYPA
ncbi:MAG: anhydro-N-acetylmuramic acid kinase [Thiothrix sp.]|nr:MAG: anhydro-N-acetylmuramic acid kinase [Thiothrix sp.]